MSNSEKSEKEKFKKMLTEFDLQRGKRIHRLLETHSSSDQGLKADEEYNTWITLQLREILHELRFWAFSE